MKRLTFGLLGLSMLTITLMFSCNSSKNIRTDWGSEKIDWGLWYGWKDIWKEKKEQEVKDWEKMNLKGKVKHFIRVVFLVPTSTQQTLKNEVESLTTLFDNNGHIIDNNGYIEPFSPQIFIEDITLGSVFEDDWIFNPEDSLERNYFWYSSLQTKFGDTYKFISDGGMDEDMYSSRHYLEKRCNSKTFYKYQTSLNQVEINIFDSKDVLRQKNVCKYNDENRIVSECLYYPNDSIKIKSTYSYDEKGNLSKYIYISGERETIHRYEYENYDMQDNWLKRIEYIDDIVNSIVEREIEYFN